MAARLSKFQRAAGTLQARNSDDVRKWKWNGLLQWENQLNFRDVPFFLLTHIVKTSKRIFECSREFLEII